MKRIFSWIVVIIAIIVISIILFITGKKHKVMLINGEKGVEVPSKVAYIVDNQKAKKIKSIRANKKGVVYVKGINHEITIKFKNAEGEEKEITKKFKARISQEEIIDFAKIIDNSEDWIIYKELEQDEDE